MTRRLIRMAVVALLTTILLGCGGQAIHESESNLKCPKCGSVFTIEEGLKGIRP